MGGRPGPVATTGLVVVTTKPPFDGGVEYEVLEPEKKGHQQLGLQDVESCLPKGIRHSSTPSHYGNDEILGFTNACSPSNVKP